MPSWKDLEELTKKVNTKNEIDSLNISIDFASKLIKARLDNNLTQAQLAERAGLKQSAIARIENKGSLPRIDTVYKLASALNSEFNFYPNSNKESSSLQVQLDKLTDKIINLEAVILMLLKELQNHKKQSKPQNVALIINRDSFTSPSAYRTRITPSPNRMLIEAYSTKGVDTDDRWHQ